MKKVLVHSALIFTGSYKSIIYEDKCPSKQAIGRMDIFFFKFRQADLKSVCSRGRSRKAGGPRVDSIVQHELWPGSTIAIDFLHKPLDSLQDPPDRDALPELIGAFKILNDEPTH